MPYLPLCRWWLIWRYEMTCAHNIAKVDLALEELKVEDIIIILQAQTMTFSERQGCTAAKIKR